MASSLKSTGSTTAWRKLRKAVLFRDAECCYWCGGHATTVDHLLERSKGGGDEMDNLVAACTKCNYGRVGAKMLKDEFFNTAGTPLTLPVGFIPENGSTSHD